MELTQEQIETILTNYKKKREREKTYYHSVKQVDDEFIAKNRDRAKDHYKKNREKKLEHYKENKEFLGARQLYYYYRRNDRGADFKEKHPDKYTMMSQKGLIKVDE